MAYVSVATLTSQEGGQIGARDRVCAWHSERQSPRTQSTGANGSCWWMATAGHTHTVKGLQGLGFPIGLGVHTRGDDLDDVARCRPGEACSTV